MTSTVGAGAAAGLAEIVAPVARALGIELPHAAYEKLDRFAVLFLAWNERINLSGARDLESFAREHVADAFGLVPHLPAAGRCIDVGSGAGLPGIVLAVVRPDLEFLLLEPARKRRAFLAAVVRELRLPNVTLAGERIDAHLRLHAGQYDFAVARAVFPLLEWLTLGERLVREGGLVAGLAGGKLPPDATRDAETIPYETGAGPRLVVLRRRQVVPRGTNAATE